MKELYPCGIINVAAGGNFTAVVTKDGSVFSFGHSEYNQHGANNRSHQDYVDSFYYYEPRKVEILEQIGGSKYNNDSSGVRTATGRVQFLQEIVSRRNIHDRSQAAAAPHPPSPRDSPNSVSKKEIKHIEEQDPQQLRIKSLALGSSFTLAITRSGDVISWGWNDGGVLGQDIATYAAPPGFVRNIGTFATGCRVKQLSAGSKHVVALTESHGNAWAGSFMSVLKSAETGSADCVIHIENRSTSSAAAAVTASIGKYTHIDPKIQQMQFPCHRAMLAARSKYLAGYIKAAEKAALDNNDGILHITLPSFHANTVTVRSLLQYLYLDVIQIPSHKKKEFHNLANDLKIERLLSLLSSGKYYYYLVAELTIITKLLKPL